VRLDDEPRLELESYLPIQAVHNRPLTGPQKLLLGILVDAIDCLRGGEANTRFRGAAIRHYEAMMWVRDTDYTWPCSFVNCCFALGLDPDRLRSGLKPLLRPRARGPLPYRGRDIFFWSQGPRVGRELKIVKHAGLYHVTVRTPVGIYVLDGLFSDSEEARDMGCEVWRRLRTEAKVVVGGVDAA
jgi:hypothetical protein